MKRVVIAAIVSLSFVATIYARMTVIGVAGVVSGQPAEITKIAATSSIVETAGTTYTRALTIPADGANRVLVVTVGSYYDGTIGSRTVTGVTYNGDAMTEYGGAQKNVGSDNTFVSMWYLVNPDTGSSYNIVATYSGSVDERAIGGVAFSGVSATPFRGAAATATGTSTTASVAVTSAEGDVVIDGIAAYISASVGAGQTSAFNSADTGVLAGSTEPGVASVTMSWATTDGDWAIVAGSLQPAE